MPPARFRLFWCLLGLALLPSPLTAQDWTQPWADPQDRPPRVDLSAFVGFLAPTDWSDLVLIGSISAGSGILEQVLVRDLRVEPDTEFGAAVTYWQGKYGVRVQAGFSSSSVVIGGSAPGAFLSPAGTTDFVAVDLDTWLYDLRGAIGMVEYTPRRWVWPYAFVGFGGITYDLARTISPPLMTFIERRGRSEGRGDIVIVDERTRAFLLAVDELGLETVFAFNFGAGADFRIPLGPAGVGLRLEVSDHVAPSPVGLRIGELRRSGALASDTGVRFAPVHHLRAAAGVVLQIGR